ncbi:MAG: tetratricopeptide repeat protein [Acidimicrobiia bacterium]
MNEAYERFMEGQELLTSGNPGDAVVALERARDLEPEQGSIREALARAYFRIRRFSDAETEFTKVVELDPVNDYAHFGIGLCAMRQGDPDRARGHLKLATVMRPESEAYRDALALISE